ncbi:hypothetical protein GCM10027343_03390 [Noviherbaspirillum agri]
MTRVLPRTNFHSSKLIRCLADLAIAETADAGQAFAEQLGQWIHFADAINLSSVHGDSAAALRKMQPEARAAARDVALDAACAEYDRIQALLANSIRKSCSPNPGRAHIKLPEPILELSMDVAAAYAPYRRFYEAHQRDMELGIQPLRVNVRETVAKASPRLRKLAELDAAFERILRERESKSLSRISLLLKKRFEQLFKEHQQQLAEAKQTDNPVRWTQTGGWLARFHSDVQTLLLAELELRLQPALGLIEAFKQDTQ